MFALGFIDKQTLTVTFYLFGKSTIHDQWWLNGKMFDFEYVGCEFNSHVCYSFCLKGELESFDS